MIRLNLLSHLNMPPLRAYSCKICCSVVLLGGTFEGWIGLDEFEGLDNYDD
jgi:hypothetical protein